MFHSFHGSVSKQEELPVLDSIKHLIQMDIQNEIYMVLSSTIQSNTESYGISMYDLLRLAFRVLPL